MYSNDSQPNTMAFLLAISLPSALACFDMFGFNVCLHSIGQYFLVSSGSLSWLLSLYTLAVVGLYIFLGRLCDKLGAKNTLFVGSLLMGIVSVFGALSWSYSVLLVVRFLQGITSSMVLVSGISIAKSQSKYFNVNLLSVWLLATAIGSASGPFLGGVIVHFWQWRGVFWLISVLAIFSALLVYLLPITCMKSIGRGFDPLGLLLLFCLMSLLLFIVHFIGISYKFSLVLFGFFLVILALLLLWEKHTKSPLLDLNLLKNKTYNLSCLIGMGMYYSLYTILFAFAIYFPKQFHWSAFQTGVMFTLICVAFIFGTSIVGKFIQTVSLKYFFISGFVLEVTAFLIMGLHAWQEPMPYIIAFLCFGLGYSSLSQPSLTLSAKQLTPDNTGVGLGMSLTIRWIGGTLGVAVTSVEMFSLGLSSDWQILLPCLTVVFLLCVIALSLLVFSRNNSF